MPPLRRMQERAAANWRTFDSASIEYHPDDVITDKAELLTPVYLMTTSDARCTNRYGLQQLHQYVQPVSGLRDEIQACAACVDF
ncbi:hypothetical protein CQT90_20115 [Salmonella enterica]|nr:hypothetical protein [Salmonella enterica]ECD0154690.1 hypothetical protein [Salmonella enterica subsp. enterica]ECD4441249.1 hypothetical protein [Salmonella enterica subsp. enterica serovar Florida]ECH9653720.1 hypothetical protein [Salmonella enterica subsp. enterica serovar Miami]ECX3454175.1 hypothetical protein [Salmonella enterica subsp. enterica serovar Rubislaw]EDN5013875.1 hypothetical protein [Salmonella enterica subsp. enterica serovar Javiana]EDR3486681.1 hypothetical protein 